MQRDGCLVPFSLPHTLQCRQAQLLTWYWHSVLASSGWSGSILWTSHCVIKGYGLPFLGLSPCEDTIPFLSGESSNKLVFGKEKPDLVLDCELGGTSSIMGFPVSETVRINFLLFHKIMQKVIRPPHGNLRIPTQHFGQWGLAGADHVIFRTKLHPYTQLELCVAGTLWDSKAKVGSWCQRLTEEEDTVSGHLVTVPLIRIQIGTWATGSWIRNGFPF